MSHTSPAILTHHDICMPLFDDQGFGGQWRDCVYTLLTEERNATDPHGPIFEPKLRIQWTRDHLWIYNTILAVVLLCVWLLRCVGSSYSRRRLGDAQKQDEALDGTASDSSSTLTGTATPPDVKDDNQPTDEETPLLGKTGTTRQSSIWCRLAWSIRAFLMYQPRPLPLVHKVLPDNGTTLFILAFLLTNILFIFINIPLEPRMLFVYGDRCAALFAANLPLLYLLAAKNQPLKHLIGFSYEGLNIFHRRLGELLCFLAVLHMAAAFYIWYALLRPLLGITLLRFLNNQLVLCGLVCFISYETLYFTSLGSFRQRWYEIFLATHVLLQALGLGFLWFHYYTSRPYVGACVLIFLIDRIAYRLLLNSTLLTADLSILDDGETLRLSADWAIPTVATKRPLLLGRTSIRHGWQPAEHVFITIPALSRSAVLQAHPFTIASAAPTAGQTYAWFSLLIRAHNGFTLSLLDHAKQHFRIPVRIDGPYGAPSALEMLRSSEHAVLVAGGSGIAVAFPLVWDLLNNKHPMKGRKRVTLVWVIHSASHSSWIPRERMQELEELGLEVRIPPATGVHGRPDMRALVEEVVLSEGGVGKTGVVVSGPDALNRDVRNTCSTLVRRGRDVDVAVEKFGW